MDEDNGNVTGPDSGNMKYGQINTLNTADLLQAGIAAGNIYRQTGGEVEVMELPEVRYSDNIFRLGLTAFLLFIKI